MSFRSGIRTITISIRSYIKENKNPKSLQFFPHVRACGMGGRGSFNCRSIKAIVVASRKSGKYQDHCFTRLSHLSLLHAATEFQKFSLGFKTLHITDHHEYLMEYLMEYHEYHDHHFILIYLMNILASGRLAIADLVCQNPAVHRIRLGASHAKLQKSLTEDRRQGTARIRRSNTWALRRSGGCNPHGSALCPGPRRI